MGTYASDPNKWTGTLNGAVTAPSGSTSTSKGDPVGKKFGSHEFGALAGNVKTEGAYNEAKFVVNFDSLDAGAESFITLPPYSQVTEVVVTVTEVFGTGDTVDVDLDGTSIIGATKPSVAALGVVVPALSSTAADYTVGATAEDLTIDTALIDQGTPLTGKATVLVKYRVMSD